MLFATLTQTITAAHAAGDLATAQIAARTLSELLSAPQAMPRVAPVVDLASTNDEAAFTPQPAGAPKAISRSGGERSPRRER